MHLWNHRLVGFVLSASRIHAAKPAQWRERSIYQLMTDRFARTDGDTSAFCDVREGKYCGGTWNGIKGKLDYIQGMGFDAVWISPITKNIEVSTGYGEAYHGYWQQDIYALNSHFGTPEDLRALAEALHLRGMVRRMLFLFPPSQHSQHGLTQFVVPHGGHRCEPQRLARPTRVRGLLGFQSL